MGMTTAGAAFGPAGGLGAPAEQASQQIAHDPIKLSVALITVALPGAYRPQRIADDDALPLDAAFAGSGSSGPGVEQYPHEYAHSSVGLTRLVCGEHVFDSTSAGAAGPQQVAEQLQRLLPLTAEAAVDSRSPFHATLASLWSTPGGNTGDHAAGSDRLAFALPLRALRVRSEGSPLRARAGASASASASSSSASGRDDVYFAAPLSVRAFADMVRDGKCSLTFLTQSEQQQQLAALAPSAGPASRVPPPPPGSYVLTGAGAAHAAATGAPRVLDGQVALLSRRRASKPYRPARLGRSWGELAPSALPQTSSSGVAWADVGVSTSLLYGGNATCRRAHRALALAAAALSTLNPQRAVPAVFLEHSVDISPAKVGGGLGSTRESRHLQQQRRRRGLPAMGERLTTSSSTSPSLLSLDEEENLKDAQRLEGLYQAPARILDGQFVAPSASAGEEQEDSISSVASSSSLDETAFVSVAAMVKGCNFGELAAPITEGIVEPIVEVTSTAFLTLTEFFMGKELPQILDLGLNDIVSRDLVGAVAEPLGAIFPFSITEVMQEQLPPLVAHQVAEDVVRDITPRITDQVTRRMHRVMSRVLAQDVERPARRVMNSRLGADTAHILSLSLAATITPALLHTLTHNPQQDYFCYYCDKKELYCVYCKRNRADVARQNYYAEFYAGFYARYYTAYYRDYFIALEDAREAEEAMREQQVHFDQGWKQTPRLVLENTAWPDQRWPMSVRPPKGVVEHGPTGGVAEAYAGVADGGGLGDED